MHLIPNNGSKSCNTYHSDHWISLEKFGNPAQLILEVVHPHIAYVWALESLVLQNRELLLIVIREIRGMGWEYWWLHCELGACNAGRQLGWKLHGGVGLAGTLLRIWI